MYPKAAAGRDYAKRLAAFWEFVRQRGLQVEDRQELDRALADFAEARSCGQRCGMRGRSWGARKKTSCCGSWRMWMRVAPGQSRDPLPAVVRSGVETALIHRGYVNEAIFVALAFECYLRVGECFDLAPQDVSAPVGRLAPHLRSWVEAERPRDPNKDVDVR